MELPWVWIHTDSANFHPCEGKKLGYLDFKDFSALVTLQAAHVASRWGVDEMQQVEVPAHDFKMIFIAEQTFVNIWCFIVLSQTSPTEQLQELQW